MERDDGEESEEPSEEACLEPLPSRMRSTKRPRIAPATTSSEQVGPKDAAEAAAWWDQLSKALPAFALAKLHHWLLQGVSLSTDYSGAGFFESCVEDMCLAVEAPPPVLLYACDNNSKCRKWLQSRARVPTHIFTDILDRVRPKSVDKLARLQVS